MKGFGPEIRWLVLFLMAMAADQWIGWFPDLSPQHVSGILIGGAWMSIVRGYSA